MPPLPPLPLGVAFRRVLIDKLIILDVIAALVLILVAIVLLAAVIISVLGATAVSSTTIARNIDAQLCSGLLRLCHRHAGVIAATAASSLGLVTTSPPPPLPAAALVTAAGHRSVRLSRAQVGIGSSIDIDIHVDVFVQTLLIHASRGARWGRLLGRPARRRVPRARA